METITKEHQDKINALKDVLEELYNSTKTEEKVFFDFNTPFHTAYLIETKEYKFKVLASGKENIRLIFRNSNKAAEQTFYFFTIEDIKSDSVKKLLTESINIINL